MSFLSDVKVFLDAHLPGMATPAEKAEYLDHKNTTTGEHLDWRNSDVDLLKLMGQPSSLADRAVLAKELGYPGDFAGTAEQNMWLHKQLMDHLKMTT